MKTGAELSRMNFPDRCKETSFKESINVNSCSRFCDWNDGNFLKMAMKEGIRVINYGYEPWVYAACGIIVIALCYAFYIWFCKYKLRFLLRINLMTFLLVWFLNISCSSSSYLHGWLSEYDDASYCSDKHFYKSHVLWLSGSSIIFMLFVRFHWDTPYDFKKKLDMEKTNKNGMTIQQMTEEKFHAFPDEMPPVFPNGWIPIVESSEIKVGNSKTVTALGKKFCVFRGIQGKAYITDAYCPHLGAELAAGGKVHQECIECPFHEWLFDGRNGRCVKIPYARKVPEVAKIGTWPSCEKNGFIFLWHHAENEDPSWEMTCLEEVESGNWKFRGKTDHEVHCHIQEIPENGADIAHLNAVHSKSVFLGQFKPFGLFDLLLSCIEHEWIPYGWEKDEERPYIAKVKLNQIMRILGIKLPIFHLDINIEQIGPATVHLQMKTSFGRSVLVQHIIPEGPLNHRIIHTLYTEPSFQQFPATLFLKSEAIMLERDIAIWNKKRYLKKPTLVKQDRLISSFRRWYSQFYSDNSIKMKDLKNKTLDW